MRSDSPGACIPHSPTSACRETVWGGLFYGYAFPLGNHWRIETQLGVSGGWYNDIAYECATCGLEIGPRSGWTLLPNLGVNIVYTFTKKVKE